MPRALEPDCRGKPWVPEKRAQFPVSVLGPAWFPSRGRVFRASALCLIPAVCVFGIALRASTVALHLESQCSCHYRRNTPAAPVHDTHPGRTARRPRPRPRSCGGAWRRRGARAAAAACCSRPRSRASAWRPRRCCRARSTRSAPTSVAGPSNLTSDCSSSLLTLQGIALPPF